MRRRLWAAAAGIVAAGATVFAVELASSAWFPLPPGVDPADPATMRHLAEQMPTAALALVTFGFFAGAVVGCAVAARIERDLRGPAVVVGIVQLLATVTNFAAFPHPLWMMVVAPVGCVAGARLGERIGRGR